MTFSQDQLGRAAAETGFQPEALEKVMRLLDLLEALRAHPFLTDRMVLKGGTALNLFILDVPRLSVDIDLNYVGGVARDTMMAERPTVEKAIGAVCARQGIRVRRIPGDHAGGKWRMTYDRAAGGTGALGLDVNFIHRIPLWDPVVRDSLQVAGSAAHSVLVLDPHELVAGKLSALFSRSVSRDLFDVHALLAREGLDRRKLRLAFVVYGAMSRRDWRTVSSDDVNMDAGEADRRLLPLLRADLVPERHGLEDWCALMVAECRDRLVGLLPLEPQEIEFLDQVNDRGEIVPDLLTDERSLRERIHSHPGLLWKALNVRRRAGLPGAAGDVGTGNLEGGD